MPAVKSDGTDRKELADYGVAVEKPQRERRFSPAASLRLLVLLSCFLWLLLLLLVGISRTAEKKNGDAAAILSASVAASVSQDIALEDSKKNLLVNINTADLQTLCELPGIGEKKAQAIIDYRTNNGAFSSVDEIKEVSGIGEGIYEKIRGFITIGE